MDLKLASKTLILALAGASFAVTAFAQWQWIDKDGRKVFSDRSPPADIKEKDILKRPGGTRIAATVAPAATAETAVSPAAAASAAGKAGAPKLSGKDAQLEARKKQAEDEEAAKKKADAEKVAKAKAENCDRAKRGLLTFESGVRVSITNSKGEREFMDDNARAAETKRLRDVAAADCK